uniref:Uncharacterized protein n=1 Tax=Bombyx mori TaxID=7091 RepID=A0A8R2MAJ1_BOMMO|nr:uncharacterized protein LOC119630633 [Bombyx mori]
MTESQMSTPVNTISRESLKVFITNNVFKKPLDFNSDCDMDTESPLRKPNLQPITRRLFHSPITNEDDCPTSPKGRLGRKRKRKNSADSSDRIKRAYVTECQQNDSSERCTGMRRRVLISLFHNKEYFMDVSS